VREAGGGGSFFVVFGGWIGWVVGDYFLVGGGFLCGGLGVGGG